MMRLLVIFCVVGFISCDPPHYGYRIEWFWDLDVDHFSYGNKQTFDMRYLINDTYFVKGGPILLYCGGEDDIESFAQNSGFLWDIAERLNGLIIFTEHRYFGETLPFGNSSLDDDNIVYLSTSQVLVDFVMLLRWVKQNYTDAANCPVIAFGGSYGGILSAFMRIKYRDIVQGALSSSAPILQSLRNADCSLYASGVAKSIRLSGDHCDESVRNAGPAIQRLLKSADGPKKVADILHFCAYMNLNDSFAYPDIMQWLSLTFGYLVQYNYPYAANMLKPLPAWPARAACRFLTNPNAPDEELLSSIYNAVSIYLNHTGDSPCYGFSDVLTAGYVGWWYQSCTEFVRPSCNGEDSLFFKSKWNYNVMANKCFRRFGVRPSRDWITMEYGIDSLETASNIIFSNGELDPWSGYGVLKNISNTVISLFIKDAAHHYDLSGKHIDDTQSVKDARETEIFYIKKWIDEYHKNVKVIK